jgi:hypothetical protein
MKPRPTCFAKCALADLLQVGANERHSGMAAAQQMQRFMAEAPAGEPCDIEALLNKGRD